MTSMPVAGIQAGAPAQPADLVLRDAKIFTGDPKRPAATALAVRDGSVTVVGGDREVAPLVGPRTRVVDALGHRVVPGLNDSHNHVVRGGLRFVLELRWDGVPTLRQGLARVREQAARTGRHPGLDVQPLGRPVLAVYGRNVAGVPLRSGRTAWTGPKPSPRTPPAVPGSRASRTSRASSVPATTRTSQC